MPPATAAVPLPAAACCCSRSWRWAVLAAACTLSCCCGDAASSASADGAKTGAQEFGGKFQCMCHRSRPAPPSPAACFPDSFAQQQRQQRSLKVFKTKLAMRAGPLQPHLPPPSLARSLPLDFACPPAPPAPRSSPIACAGAGWMACCSSKCHPAVIGPRSVPTGQGTARVIEGAKLFAPHALTAVKEALGRLGYARRVSQPERPPGNLGSSWTSSWTTGLASPPGLIIRVDVPYTRVHFTCNRLCKAANKFRLNIARCQC